MAPNAPVPIVKNQGTFFPHLYERAKNGNATDIKKFLSDYIELLFFELKVDARLMWEEPNALYPFPGVHRFSITYKNNVTAYGAVSASENLDDLKRAESERLKRQVVPYTVRRTGYIIVTAKNDGLKAEFAQVFDKPMVDPATGQLTDEPSWPVVSGVKTLDFEVAADEHMFKELLSHCILFAH
ncbi:hypothetical protein PRK78_006948 [Emydomyces testavorans]|uniref:Uncharacterized protein n=1 Tax=Emydomyces testavorans TaxID=2070801 RepID=A0AAF0DN56_9EURO|nr:hypothetical protein PRK78_006948 [Emydomyces testavorans]